MEPRVGGRQLDNVSMPTLEPVLPWVFVPQSPPPPPPEPSPPEAFVAPTGAPSGPRPVPYRSDWSCSVARAWWSLDGRRRDGDQLNPLLQELRIYWASQRAMLSSSTTLSVQAQDLLLTQLSAHEHEVQCMLETFNPWSGLS